MYPSNVVDELGLWSRFIDEYADSMTHSDLESTSCITFIVLADLTWQMPSPTIIDIKLGQFVPLKTLSLSKLQSHKAKYDSTTSSSLGLRLCGLKSRRLSKDKYWGRDLDHNSLSECLNLVISDSMKRPLISQLQGLLEVIMRDIVLRFYSASLLIIIDEDRGSCRVCMIDFAHSGSKHIMQVHDNVELIDINHGTVFGIQNLISMLN